MKKFPSQNLILVLILILSLFLRVYRFDKAPPGLDWDEVATGYNAYSILKTARDEHGEFLPLNFKSFDDYKAPLFIYLLVPFVKVFGRTIFAVRFPSALLGTLTVFLTYFLAKELFREKNKNINRKSINDWLPVITAFLLAVSPWHLQFSRVAFEPNIALFFVVLGGVLMLKGLRRDSTLLCISGSASLALSLLTYHSSKIFTPLLFFSLILIFKKDFLKNKKKLFLTLLIFLLFCLPVFLTFFKGGGSRLQATGIFGRFSTIEEIGRLRKENQDKPFWLVRILYNRPVFLSKKMISNYFSHFSPYFLFLGKKTNWRVSLPFQGQLYLWEGPFFLLGIYHLLLSFKKRSSKLMLSWWLLAPLPASIGESVPHALRTLAMLPMPQLFTALGMVKFLKLIRKYKLIKPSFVYELLFLIFLFSFGSYFYNYHVKFPYESGFDWQEGHQEMVEFVRGYEGKVEKIVVTDYYMQPYIFFLWFGKIEPEVYQAKGLPDYEFRRINWEEDSQREDVILVGVEEEIPTSEKISEKIIKEIKFSNGKTAFKIVKT